jgi:hypothetical protein
MRTTVDVQDDLLRRARELALREGRTLGDVVDDALRAMFDRESQPAELPRLPVARWSDLAPGVDWSPRTLKDILAEEDEERFRP